MLSVRRSALSPRAGRPSLPGLALAALAALLVSCASDEPRRGGGRWTRVDTCPDGRCPTSGFTLCTWTGRELLWYAGGSTASMRFDPATGAVTTFTPATPLGDRAEPPWVRVGDLLWIWGGFEPGVAGSGYQSDGATWDPATDTWTPFAPITPSPRSGAVAVEVGGRVLLWGGIPIYPATTMHPGILWTQSTGAWHRTSLTGAPTTSSRPAAVWTGQEVLIWGGGQHSSGIYDPAQDTWRPMNVKGSPALVSASLSVWTGSRLLVWGTAMEDAMAGGSYDPVRDRWSPMSTEGAMRERGSSFAHWTGSDLIVINREHFTRDSELLALYSPDQNRWTKATTEGEPPVHSVSCTGWDGRRALLWGRRNGERRPDGTTEQWTEVWAYEPAPP